MVYDKCVPSSTMESHVPRKVQKVLDAQENVAISWGDPIFP